MGFELPIKHTFQTFTPLYVSGLELPEQWQAFFEFRPLILIILVKEGLHILFITIDHFDQAANIQEKLPSLEQKCRGSCLTIIGIAITLRSQGLACLLEGILRFMHHRLSLFQGMQKSLPSTLLTFRWRVLFTRLL